MADTYKGIEYPYWREYLLFPYRLLVSWWLDTLLHRPSNTVFKRAFENEFGWFLTKRDCRLIENPCLYNLLGVYLNAKLLTARSSDVEIRFTSLVDEFSVTVRPAWSRARWQSLSTVFVELEQSPTLSWHAMIEFLDMHWIRLAETMSANP
jgi:hypothetical protein